MMTESSNRSRGVRADWLLLCFLFLSLGCNVMLALALARGPRVGTEPALATGPAIGAVLPPLEARRLGGAIETIRFEDVPTPTVLYFFTPSCKWCVRNLDNVRALAKVAEAGRFRLIGISLSSADGLNEYVIKEQLHFPIYFDASAGAMAAYVTGVTPETLVVSREGKLERSWRGAYGGAVKSQVEEWLGRTLPGFLTASIRTKGVE